MSELTNQEKLEETYRLVRENNHLLHKLQTRSRITAIFQIIYWLAIVGALGGVYLYIKPFYEAIQNNSSKAQGILQNFESLREQFPETKAFQEFFNQLKASTSQESIEETPTETQ